MGWINGWGVLHGEDGDEDEDDQDEDGRKTYFGVGSSIVNGLEDAGGGNGGLSHQVGVGLAINQSQWFF